MAQLGIGHPARVSSGDSLNIPLPGSVIIFSGNSRYFLSSQRVGRHRKIREGWKQKRNAFGASIVVRRPKQKFAPSLSCSAVRLALFHDLSVLEDCF